MPEFLPRSIIEKTTKINRYCVTTTTGTRVSFFIPVLSGRPPTPHIRRRICCRISFFRRLEFSGLTIARFFVRTAVMPFVSIIFYENKPRFFTIGYLYFSRLQRVNTETNAELDFIRKCCQTVSSQTRTSLPLHCFAYRRVVFQQSVLLYPENPC